MNRFEQAKNKVLEGLGELKQQHLEKSHEKRQKKEVSLFVREAVFGDCLREAVYDVESRMPTLPPVLAVPPPLPTDSQEKERCVVCVISDVHIGEETLADGLGKKYGRQQESRRIAHLTEQICSFKQQYKNRTCYLLFAGDLISGKLHDPTEGRLLSEQMTDAMYLFSSLVRRVAAAYRKVVVYSVAGNHDRNKHRHEERATYEKHDSFERVIMDGIRHLCGSMGGNVEWHLDDTPVAFPVICGHTFAVTHGDTHLKGGVVGKSVNMEKIQTFVCSLNSDRAMQGLPPIEGLIVGHYHVPTMSISPQGVTVVVNGAMVPPNAFAKSIGIHGAKGAGQWIFETTESYPIGDTRLVRFDERVDENEELDQIIPPLVRR